MGGKLAGMLLAAFLALPAAAAAEGDAPLRVKVGVLVTGFANYDAAAGTYDADMYLWFRWDPAHAPANFTPASFEMENGEATARELNSRIVPGTGERETYFRVQGHFRATPDLTDYPFDRQVLWLVLEDGFRNESGLVYEPIRAGSGLAPGTTVPGWALRGTDLAVSSHTYGWGERYSRLTLAVEVGREPVSSALATLLPPLLILLVTAATFLLRSAPVHERVTIVSGMLVSAAVFHAAQVSGLPPWGSLRLFDRVMVSCYVFILGALLLTLLPHVARGPVGRRLTQRSIDRAGPWVLVLLGAVTYGILLLSR